LLDRHGRGRPHPHHLSRCPGGGRRRGDLRRALGEAGRSLIVALQYRIKKREPIPEPSRAAKGQRSFALPALAAAKLALNREMGTGLTTATLAAGLAGETARNPPSARLGHASHIRHVEAALRVLGKELRWRPRPGV
jgi:antitoxin HicB